MLSYQYHRVLKKIAEITFPDSRILHFKIDIHPKELKSKHGDYRPHLIRIFNLSQKVDYTISTALHELAHHCEYSIYGDTGHSKRFYEVFKDLLETSIKMNIVDYNVIRTQNNASDLTSLERYFGPVTTTFDPAFTSDETVIKALNSFHCRQELQERGYFYDKVEKAWGKILPNKEIEKEEQFLLTRLTPKDIIKRDLYDLTFEAIYFVFVPGGYQIKDNLQQYGYFYKIIKSKKGWAKRIVATDLDQEKLFLNSLNVEDYKVLSSLK
ncbi:hypothetical protein CN918_27370 [Priestia megaterium]|nr:hypothetical protein CN918_27370 [Priestia megaterium]